MKEEILSYAAAWTELENISLNETSQTQNDRQHVISLNAVEQSTSLYKRGKRSTRQGQPEETHEGN